MNSKVRQQNSKIHPSKSFLRLIEPSITSYNDQYATAGKSTRAKSGLKSTLKSRKLAELLEPAKTNVSYTSNNQSLCPNDTQKSYQTGYNLLAESSRYSNEQSCSRSNSPNKGSKMKFQAMRSKGTLDSSKFIRLQGESAGKSTERITSKKIIENRRIHIGNIGMLIQANDCYF